VNYSVFHLLLVGCGAAAGVWMLCYPVRVALARSSIIDRPNQRSSHSRPTPRGGGIAIMLVLLLVVAGDGGLRRGQPAVLATLLSAAALLAVVSFVDDLRSLPARLRFGCHGLAAVATLVVLKVTGLRLVVDSGGFPWPAMALVWLLGFLWIVGYTNAFNFMDGINGLAAGQAIVTGFGMALLGLVASAQWSVVSPPVLLSLVIAGAALGFMPHNFPKARIFMGDVGSASVGFLLAALVLWIARDYGWWLLIPLGLLHANFVLDTGVTLARRILRGERWHEAHREHFYQRLIRSGKSHPFVTGLEMTLEGVVLGLMVLYLHASVPVRVGLIALVILVWLVFFAYCERLFLRSNFEQKLTC
jgi:UDP-N-acetylmuramyl pentapeptide phosphotransferase/UDP-N-acetylglucosamine-1-phosphate transferase